MFRRSNNKTNEVGFVDEMEPMRDTATATSFSVRSLRSLPSPRFFRRLHKPKQEPIVLVSTPEVDLPLDSNITIISEEDGEDGKEEANEQLLLLLKQNQQLVQQAVQELGLGKQALESFELEIKQRVRIWLGRSAVVPLAMAVLYLDALFVVGFVLALLALSEYVFSLDRIQMSPVQLALDSTSELLSRLQWEQQVREAKEPEKVLTATLDELDMTGYQFNVFAMIPKDVLDFERDVLSKLSPTEQQKYALIHKANTTRADEFMQLRFLQADKYDVDKALARLKYTCEWRSKLVDPFVNNVNWALIRRAKALRPRAYCGLDKLGRPLYAEKLGEFFSNDEAHRGLSMDQWILSYSFEMCEMNNEFRLSVLQGYPYSHRMGFIADIGGLRLSFLRVVHLLQKLVKEVETHFPEMAGPIMLINSPSFVTRAWSLVKKFLDPATVEKISFYGPLSTFQGPLCEVFGETVVPVE
ncbi:hypothetical protein BASA81_002772 [Batrachochytrium salamandrivorans]|nr:hypothetical protein BASA81_002772 [Batrachochytrium salamandrivorans]